MTLFRVYLNDRLLTDNPKGLQDMQVIFERDNQLYGIYAVTLINLVFVGDGFCRLIELEADPDACEITVDIDILCGTEYKRRFTGIIPVANIKFDLSNKEVEVEIEDNNPLALISRNAEVDFDFNSDNDIFGNPLFDQSNPYTNIDLYSEIASYVYTNRPGIYIKTAIERIVNFMTGSRCVLDSDFLINTTPILQKWIIQFSASPGINQQTTVTYRNYYGKENTISATSTGNQHIADLQALLELNLLASPSTPDDVRQVFREYNKNEFQVSIGSASPLNRIALDTNVPFEILRVQTVGTADVSFHLQDQLVDSAIGIYFFDWAGLHGVSGNIVLTFKKIIEEINKVTGCSFFVSYDRDADILNMRLEPDRFFLDRPIAYTFDEVKELKTEVDTDFTHDKIELGSQQSQKSKLNEEITFSSPFCGINNSLNLNNDFIIDSVQIWVDLAASFDPTDNNSNIYMIQSGASQATQFDLTIAISGVSAGTLRFYNNYLNNFVKTLRYMTRFKSNFLGSPDIMIENIATRKLIKTYRFKKNISNITFNGLLDGIPERIAFKTKGESEYRNGILKGLTYNFKTGESEFNIIGQ